MNIPQHIAIIMDGNGRWAKKRGLPRTLGHRQGIEAVKRVVKACVKFNIKYLTLYAFSMENWQRPEKEVKVLFSLLENFLDTQMKLFHENNVRLRVIGERDMIEPRVIERIEGVERETAAYNKLILNIALSYSGRREILNAVRDISRQVKNGVIKPSHIDERLFSMYLYTKDCPDPDLLIRTSGEMRISNFLLWQISYTEFYVTRKLWPDFNESDLKEAIEEYQKRDRKFGR